MLPLTPEEQRQVALITYCATILADVLNTTDKKKARCAI